MDIKLKEFPSLDFKFKNHLANLLPKDLILDARLNDLKSSPTSLLREFLSTKEISLLGARASEKRVREFCLGRISAKAALVELTKESEPRKFEILRLGISAPLWPTNFIGSISHCTNKAISVVGYSNVYLGIGIDIITKERQTNINLLNTLCSENEKISIENKWLHTENDLRLCVFSAKESLYKLFSSLEFKGLHWTDFSLEDLTEENGSDSFRCKVKLDSSVRNKSLKYGRVVYQSDINMQIVFYDNYIFSFTYLINP